MTFQQWAAAIFTEVGWILFIIGKILLQSGSAMAAYEYFLTNGRNYLFLTPHHAHPHNVSEMIEKEATLTDIAISVFGVSVNLSMSFTIP